MSKNKFTTDIEVKSEKKSIKLIEPVLYQLKKDLKLKEEVFYNILIATIEAVNNAIIHGNKLELEKVVRININANSKKITISVQDQGKGFNPDKVADPRTPENLYKESGRGVFLISELTDNYEYVFSSQGSRLIMHFLL